MEILYLRNVVSSHRGLVNGKQCILIFALPYILDLEQNLWQTYQIVYLFC